MLITVINPQPNVVKSFLGGFVIPNVAKVEDAAAARRPFDRLRGLAVVVYAESLTTQQMRYHRLSRRVNNRAIMTWFLDITRWGFYERNSSAAKACLNK